MAGRAEEVACIWPAGASLGEGPLWSADEKRLYWVDIKGGAIHRCRADGSARERFPLGREVGCLALRDGGGLIVALRSEIAFLDLATGAHKTVAAPEPDRPGNRFNDGKCDRSGRFWAGTMDDAVVEATGALYRLDGDRSLARVIDGFIVANGLGWSPDNRTMYFTDSERRTILAFAFDPATGDIDNRRVFATVADNAGVPDGLTVDSQGYVWSAHWDGWRVTRYDPEGGIDRVIDMPVPRPTSCTFGGAALDTLFVTSAMEGLSPAMREAAPLSGGLFAHAPGVRGLPEPGFAG